MRRSRFTEEQTIGVPREQESGAGQLAIWKDDCNTVRPHSAIGNVPPAVYAKLSDPAKQRDGSLELPQGSTAHPVAPPSLMGSNDQRTLLPTG
jgi:putative transposase